MIIFPLFIVTPNDILRVAEIHDLKTELWNGSRYPQNIESNNSKNLLVEEEYTGEQRNRED